jgi:hypothetical protein
VSVTDPFTTHPVQVVVETSAVVGHPGPWP